MTPEQSIDEAGPSREAERFFEGTVRRILKFLIVLSGVLVLPVLWFFGSVAALGFLLGAFVSWLNFRSLSRSVGDIADRIVEHHTNERGHIVVVRFLLRYVLVAGIAYVIFKGSPMAFRGFLFGVCLPAAAMLVEAAYEGYMALRRNY